MEPVVCPVQGTEAWRFGRTQNEAKVVFLLGEQMAAERAAQRLFQRPLALCEYAELAGAPDDAKVEIGVLRGSLYMELSDPVEAAYRAYFYVRRAGDHLILVNDGFHIQHRAMRGRGLALRMFRRQAACAARLGVSRVETVAGRRVNENGYYTWPRFGFDARLSENIRRTLPIDFKDARTLLDIMERDAGRMWWREHGRTTRVRFDLAPGSRSWQSLNRYVRERAAGGRRTERVS